MMKGMMTMVVVKELLWLFVVVMTAMATDTQQQQQQQSSTELLPSAHASSLPPPSPPPTPPPTPPPPSPSLPADDHGRRRSSGGVEEMEEMDEGHQLNLMTTIPSDDDDDEPFILATGDTAILECRIPTAATAATAAAAVGRSKNLSWTNTLTKTKMTANITTFQNTSLTSVNSNETMSLILTITNVTVAKNEFVCELDADQNLQMKRTVKFTVLSSDSFCTFEGETTGVWKVGNVWTREHSVSAASSHYASCDAAGFSDHTYGKNNTNGHFLMARLTDDRQTEGATLNATARNVTQCIRFYYRTCVTNDYRGGEGRGGGGGEGGGGGAVVQLMLMTIIRGISSSPLLINLSLTSDWTRHSLILPAHNQEQQQPEIVMSFSCPNASDFTYIAIDDIRMEDDNCEPANQQQVTKMESISESSSSLLLLLRAPTSTITTTNALVATAGSSQTSTSKTTTTSEISSSATTTTTATKPTSPTSPTTTTPTTPTTKASSSSALPPTTTTVAMIQPTATSTSTHLTSSSSWSLLSATSKLTPEDSEDPSIRPTDYDRSSAVAAAAAVDEAEAAGADEANDDGTAGVGGAGAATGDNSTGLAIGIILAIMVAGACTAAILYRRRKNGKKSTYITFGNPSYSREHLPVNDFGLDSPLTLSSNGYTVLA